MVILLQFGSQLLAEEWFPIDDRAKQHFSLRAAKTSDYTLSIGVGEAIYSHMHIADSQLQSLAWQQFMLVEWLNYSLTHAVKGWAQRARPYTYHSSAAAKKYALENKGDTTRSFYSGHASTAFATSYSVLKTQIGQFERAEKQRLLFSSFFMASSTAMLRVVAGKHFYTDIVVGAVMGALSTELAHTVVGARRRFHEVEDSDYNFVAGGILLGALWPHLVDFGDNFALNPQLGTGQMAMELRYHW